MSTLYLVFRDLQRSNQGPTGLQEQSQFNEPSFCFLIRLQDTKNQCRGSKNRWHYFEYL